MIVVMLKVPKNIGMAKKPLSLPLPLPVVVLCDLAVAFAVTKISPLPFSVNFVAKAVAVTRSF
ncbi:MAG: hypothetical protein GY794_02750 [bacterium]|nr:hypothetical protein [bacterium]